MFMQFLLLYNHQLTVLSSIYWKCQFFYKLTQNYPKFIINAIIRSKHNSHEQKVWLGCFQTLKIHLSLASQQPFKSRQKIKLWKWYYPFEKSLTKQLHSSPKNTRFLKCCRPKVCKLISLFVKRLRNRRD